MAAPDAYIRPDPGSLRKRINEIAIRLGTLEDEADSERRILLAQGIGAARIALTKGIGAEIDMGWNAKKGRR